ncbi:family 43 glycosylhydrolase [Streptomyces sp. NPDC097619]|uniref:family 43 glycosylhydrolase n=1 Tax=Streptomyces sp. NPDC097619 TaxID=3157228 RepID=UPI0033171D5B
MLPEVVRRTGRRAACAAVLAVALGLPALASAASLGPGLRSGPVPGPVPVLDRDFADPDVLRVGDTYHAYATNGAGAHVQRATSTDLVHWTPAAADPLPRLGDWAEPERTLVWAPEVFDHGDGYTLLYTARDRASGRQCVGAALAAGPEGPFRPVAGGPLVCPAAEGGAIDAASHTEDGRRYVLWKNDGNCCGLPARIHLQPVSWDGARTAGPSVPLVGRDLDWEGELVEAPTLVRREDRYHLFYSADSYTDERYKTGYAVASALTGPYVKGTEPLMSTDSFGGTVRGPGGQDVVTGPDGRDRILFHGWSPDGSRRRVLYAADLGFAGGRPVVRGSRSGYEAERADVRNARVRETAGASGGRAVGWIDHADSSVEFAVFAASSGPHVLSVRYGNGSLDANGQPVPASHGLSVNGRAAAGGRIAYPYTGWDRWRSVTVTVELTAGRNTVALTKDAYYAELDRVDVA